MTDIFVNTLQFSFKLNTLLFPLDVDEFLIKLEELKYKGVQKGYSTPEGLPTRPGDVAVKNNTFINIENQAQIITLSSISVKEILEVFNEIKAPLKISGIDIEKDVRAFSIVSDYIVNTGNNAFEKIGKFIGTNDALKSINMITGIESQQYSINLLSKEKSILDESLFQLRIEPYLKRLGKTYFVQYTQRDPDLNLIIEKIGKIENDITDIIKTIESQ